MSFQSDNLRNLSRRQFLKRACLAAAGAAGTLSAMHSGIPVLATVEGTQGRMEYRRLGRTDLKVSAVVAGEMPAQFLHERAFELGVNYWHKMGNWALPELFAKRDRDSFYCDMVVDTLNKDGAIAQFEWGLKYSGLTMIDFIKVHSLYRVPEDVKRGEGIFQAFEYLKKRGKTRFLAVAQHVNTAEVLTACIESGHFDAIQPNFNVLSPKEMHGMIALAKKHDVGVICKKVLVGGERYWKKRPGLKKKVEKYLDSKTTLGQALLKWALATPGVTAVIPFVRNLKQLEEDVVVGFSAKASPKSGSLPDQRALELFAEALSNDYCRSCGECISACPRQIAVPDILRYTMYYVGYAQTDYARQMYRNLPKVQAANQCNACGACESACPHGLPIMGKLREAHALLA
ncbi:MAG: aldo/keto reductase [Candidatus Poribacteria bacterium]